MLPPGHVAGGYLATYALLKFTAPQVTPHEYQLLLGLGAFFGFAPDLDMFIGFARHKHLTVLPQEVNHRNLPTHAPLNWLIAALVMVAVAHSTFGYCLGLTLWIGSWSHFFLDSFGYGIMWLWPFSKKVYAFRSAGVDYHNREQGFFNYWIKFLLAYTTRLPFYLELLVIAAALIVFFHNH